MKKEQMDALEYEQIEKARMDMEYQFVTDFIRWRKQLGLSQQKVANESDVIRETIARIEASMCSPQVDTLLKILVPFGYTLQIVPIEKVEGSQEEK